MNSPRDLRRRIKSITGTAQITKAMQMVAASKMRKAQQAAIEAQAFAHALYRIQRSAVAHAPGFQHPLIEKREVRRRAVILVAADKGLCGALNTNVFRLASQFDQASTVFITAGRRASQFVARTRRQLAAEFSYDDTPTFAEARAIASLARELFVKKEVDEVRLVATRYVNTLTQEPVSLEFLPVGEISDARIPGVTAGSIDDIDPTEAVFEPDVESVLGYLLERYLNIYAYYVLLNAKASEQSARMVSMKNATDAAADLIRDLKLEYNKLRQGNITRELLEIAGGQAE
ncbi:MAG TPA: ATP synthase F1 subunit gamma [Vicinamibacterales bacterium]|jgi:F-type H+-transporting ATPase subunit gamma|nr:ATP synthase F1 subunit gamma [Vicinamibacterales bacterium]